MKSTLLLPFSWLYGAGIRARNFLYQNNFFKTTELEVKTISVGNLTVGGTGKTPLVALMAEMLTAQGEKVCILTRGYGRDDPKERVLVSDGQKILADVREAGDEPFELAQQLAGKAVIVADAKRAEAGKWARKEFGITVFILDDGFQHRQLKRDLDLVLIDATSPFGNGKLLPAGRLRETLTGLKRAHAVIITRANLVEDLSEIRAKILQINPDCQIFVSENKFTGLVKLKDFLSTSSQNPVSEIRNWRTLAFCALGNPDNFFEQLRRENLNLAHTKAFPDHYLYRQTEIRNIEKEAVEKRAEVLLTTAKDAVKLRHLKFNFPCYVVKNGLTIKDESVFVNLIRKPKFEIN